MKQTCLNGWWDIAPVSSPETFPTEQEWQSGAYLVPSPYTLSPHAVRAEGEEYYHNRSRDPDAEVYVPGNEFLFDTHGYPPEWGAAPAAFARRTLELTRPESGKRLFLKFEAIAASSAVWFNGKELARHLDAFLPVEIEITDEIQDGENEVLVGMFDYPRDPENPDKSLLPCGNMFTMHVRGIWQDCWLVERGETFVSSAWIRTSVRNQELTADLNLDGPVDGVELRVDVADWQGEVLRTVYEGPAHSSLSFTQSWADAILWEPEHPHLYELRFTVLRNGEEIDTSRERFGFREVWWEGPDMMLNGHPVHMFSDWGHKVTCYHHTEEWNRQWYSWMKENNLNHTRFHTHPHPRIVMDLADEYGILVTGETGIHGSDGRQAADCDAYWEHAREHVRQYIERDRNHPSLVLWSVENEMRWNQDRTDKTREELPKLYDWFRELDPTREAYHEGDSSMWDETGVAIISRHYGKDCAGIGWWKQDKPLHSGEMASYHYMCPTTNFHTGNGDALWEDYAEIVRGGAIESSLTIEAGRTTGVCCFGPWNLSCLVNLRFPESDLTLDPGDVTAPGIKPLKVPAYTSEFAFWEPGHAPRPFVANDYQKDAFRPFAVIDLSHRRAYFSGQQVERSVWLINDTATAQEGEFTFTLRQQEETLAEIRVPFQLKRGEKTEVPVNIAVPNTNGAVDAELTAVSSSGETLDQRTQHWNISSRQEAPDLGSATILLIGEGASTEWLSRTDAQIESLPEFSSPLNGSWDLVVLEENTVRPGSQQNEWVRSYMEQGGRVLVLEQQISLFDGAPLGNKNCLNGFIRSPDHAAMHGLKHEDVAYWGEEAFADMNSDAAVVIRPYLKDDTLDLKPLADCGEGGFGLNLMAYTMVGELTHGTGRLIASQLRLNEKGDTIPECRRIFFNLVQHLIESPSTNRKTAQEPCQADSASLEAARAGAQVLLHVSTPDEVQALADATGIVLELEEAEHYQGIVRPTAETEGLSNDDACGVNSFTYCFGETAWPVATVHLKPNPSLEPLIETPCKSLIKEFFVDGQRTEAVRTYNVSKLYDADAVAEGLLLARLPLGNGSLILSTLSNAEEGNPRVKRVLNRVRSNLGLRDPEALTSSRVPFPETQGTGTAPLWLSTEVAPSLELDGVDLTTPTGERLAPTGIFRLADWDLVSPEEVIAPESSSQVYYTCFLSPRARRIELKDSGIPDPKSLTFLDLAGPSGSVQVFLNGEDLGSQPLKADGVSFADLELEAGYNQLMVIWSGLDAPGALSHRFRNIMKEPETELRFLDPQKKTGIIRWLNVD